MAGKRISERDAALLEFSKQFYYTSCRLFAVIGEAQHDDNVEACRALESAIRRERGAR